MLLTVPQLASGRSFTHTLLVLESEIGTRVGTVLSLWIFVALLGGCQATDPNHPTTAEATLQAPDSGRDVAMFCHEGFCTGDPDPSAPGYYISSIVSHITCFNGTHTDADQDGLSDLCENSLGAAFAPELKYLNTDDIGGEPYWAARRVTGTNKILIAYLPAYYRDHGSQTWGCSLPFAHSSCYGHNGDSEIIGMQVYFDVESQHWILDAAFLSQHGVRVAPPSDPVVG